MRLPTISSDRKPKNVIIIMKFAPFWLALQFLTRIPIPRTVIYSPTAQGWSVVMYPLVGLLIGLLLVLLQEVLQYRDAPSILAAGLLLSAWVLISGGLHIDGLADCVDAYVGGHGDAARSLKIMKDPCSGPMAVTAVVLLLLLKFAAVTVLFDNNAYLPLLFSPVLGRCLIAIMLLSTPYVRSQGLAAPLLENLPRQPAFLSSLVSLLCALLVIGLWPVLCAVLVVWGVRAIAMRRIGGCTGDVLGASIELGEAAVIVSSALLLN